MRKLSLFKALLVAVCLLGGSNFAWATGDATWKASSSTATTANNTLVDDDGLTANAVYATQLISGSVTIASESFSHYITVRVNADPTVAEPNGTAYVDGSSKPSTSIVITPKYNGELTIYYMRQSTAQTDNHGTFASNDGKDLKVYKQSDASVMDAVLTIDSESSDGKNGWATKVVTLEANTTYTLAARGTTIRFYGFKYTYDDGWTDSWSRTFDDAYGITEFTNAENVELQNRSNSDATKVAGVFVGSGTKTIGYTFPSATFTASTTYTFSFEYAMSSLNNKNTNRSELSFTSSTGTQMFKLKSAAAEGNKNILVYIGTSTDELSKDKTDDEYTANCLYASNTSGGSGTNNKPKASNWYTVTISANEDDGTWVTFTPQFTQAGYSEISQKISDDVVYIGSLASTIGQHYGCLWLDNLKLRQVVSADFVADPDYYITAPVNTSRKFELSCTTEGATIYWATSELAKGADGWTVYSTEVTTAATTIYAYAEKGYSTSNIISFETGAGEMEILKDAEVLHTAANQYTISNDQSTALGSPTATVHYQLDGGVEQTSTATSVIVPITADGTLRYWLTAENYGSTEEKNINVYAYVTLATAMTYDFCTSNDNTWSQEGDEVTVSEDESKTYYIYKDQSGNVLGDGNLATTMNGGSGSVWRIQRYYGGAKNQNYAENLAVLSVKAGQVIEVTSDLVPTAKANLTAMPGNTFTGTTSFTVNENGNAVLSMPKNTVVKKIYVKSDYASISIGAAGFATYAIHECALDFTDVEGLKAFTATVTGDVVTFTPATQVPAGTGLLLKGAEGNYDVPVVASADAIASNVLYAPTTAVSGLNYDAGGYYNYILSKPAGKSIGFYRANNNSVAVGKAYLRIEKDLGAREFTFIGFDDNSVVTGISEMSNEKLGTRNGNEGMNDAVYDLQGRRVAQPTKGLYIINGKKVVY